MQAEPPAAGPGPSEHEQFLLAHPDIRHLDAVIVDLCGIVRGKRYPREQVGKLYRHGFPLPYSVYLLDVTGTSSDPCGRGFSDGDPDGVCVPVPGTLVPVPWAEAPRAQVLMTMVDGDGRPALVDPRNVAARALERFRALDLNPVVAFELEFYLIDRERDAGGRPQLPLSPLTGRREHTTQVYGIEELDGFAGFFEEVERACEVQKVPATVATSEYAPGQYEVNLLHVDDALAAADHCALLRHIVKRVARRHGVEATFMSKPFPELTGNGMHVHLSAVDGAGENVFGASDPLGSRSLAHAVGGMVATMADAVAICAPNANAYRRFGPNLFVPVTKSWGANNRSFAFRIPAGPPESRRIEHRLAGADANPYLVLAAVLAGAHHGLSKRLDPGPAWSGNACLEADPDLPLAWEPALERLQRSTLMAEYLTREYLDLYCATKRGELERFHEHLSPLEYAWYL